MLKTHDRAMQPPHNSNLGNASTQASNKPLNRLRRAVMARLFEDEAPPETLGRYQIERTLGAGGMGVVYLAHDPELDRKVALKLLHWNRGDAEGKRLLREAKGLARLSHTNVVQVHDAGAVGDKVFLAMELVQGVHLGAWLRKQPRRYKEVVDVYLQAGEGLAAAHAAGLVHRDFKPENVLVREDGVVKVADFGLVRTADTPLELAAGPQAQQLDTPVESLTRTGASVGTPAYMSPEQHLVLQTDARTDQFSFCIALYEGIYGRRPFVSETLRELIAATRADRVRFGRRPRIPRALKRVLRRGMRTNPEDRYPDMRALLGELRRVDRPKRRALRFFGGVAMLVVTFVGVFVQGDPPSVPATATATVAAAAETCDPGARVATVWNDDVKARIRARLVAALPEVGEQAAATASTAIDRYLQQWTEAYEVTCETGSEPDDSQRTARQLCLQSRFDQSRGVISVLEQADASIVSNTPQIVAALEPVDACLGESVVVRTASPSSPELSFDLARARWHNARWRGALETLARAKD